MSNTKEIEKFRLRANESQLLELAIESREHSIKEANALYGCRTAAILVDHGMSPEATGIFRRVDNDVVFFEMVEAVGDGETDATSPVVAEQPAE